MAIPQPAVTPVQEVAEARVTPRSFILALVTIAGMCVYATYYKYHLMTHFMPAAALLPLVTWIGINFVLRLALPRLALSQVEMLMIFGMVWIVATMPQMGKVSYQVTQMAAPAHFSSAENRFWEVGWPHVPKWLYLAPSEYAVGPFYTGLAPGDPIPWGPWISPLFWWFVGALGMVMSGFFASVIFFRQWTDKERLTFPLARFPVELLEESERGRGLPRVLKDWLFWAGFLCTGGVIFWNIAGYFILHLPRIPLYEELGQQVVQIGRGFPPYYLRVQPLIMGLAYHCPLNLLFTFWLLYPLNILKRGLMNRVGFSVGMEGQPATSGELLQLEAHGALIFLVGWSVWIARDHLRETFRKAFSGPRSRDDGAPVTYRTAWLGLLCSGIFVLGFFLAVGFSLHVALIQMAFMFIAYYGVTKYSAATGFSFLRPQGGRGAGIIQRLGGTANLSPGDIMGMVVVNFQGFVGGGARLLSIPATPHFFRLLGNHLRRHPLIWGALPVALLTAYVSASWANVRMFYAEGGLNSFPALGGWRQMARTVPMIEGLSPTYFDYQKVLVWVFGGAESALLTFLMSRFSGWPIHPMGVAFPQFYGFSLFLVWLPKYLIIRFGGVRLYRRSAPFWYGFIVGYLTGVGISSVVDMVWFQTSRHFVHGW